MPRKVTFDDRRLKIEPYAGIRGTFKDFALSLLSFVGRESTPLRDAMLKAERLSEEGTDAKVKEFGISPELDNELGYLLLNNTASASTAKTMIRAAERKTGLEKWRREKGYSMTIFMTMKTYLAS